MNYHSYDMTYHSSDKFLAAIKETLELFDHL